MDDKLANRSYVVAFLCVLFMTWSCSCLRSPVAEPEETTGESRPESPVEPRRPEKATPPEPSDEAESPPENHEGVAVAKSDEPILFIRETGGFVPVELAEKYHRYPMRFALYEDGRVVYRDDAFNHSTVTLTPEAMKELLAKVTDSGFLTAKLPEDRGMVILDAGVQEIGIRTDGELKSFQLSGGARFFKRQFSGNPSVRVIVRVAEMLLEYSHPEAKPFDP